MNSIDKLAHESSSDGLRMLYVARFFLVIDDPVDDFPIGYCAHSVIFRHRRRLFGFLLFAVVITVVDQSHQCTADYD